MKSAIKKMIPFGLGKKIRGVYQRILNLAYAGSNFTCPYCKNTFRKMLAGGSGHQVNIDKDIIGSGRRENCVCPRCYSTDRDRLLYLYLKEHTSILEKECSLLHIAPESSLKAFLKNFDTIKYQAGIKYHEGFYYSKDDAILDITNLSFKNETYDIIICNHVLEHVIEDGIALKEFYRVLKPNGWAILQVPISSILEKTYEDFSIVDEKEREKHFGQFDHVRIYGQDYKSRLENAGFTVEIIHPFEEWNLIEANEYAINPKEKLYIVHK